MTDYYDLIIVGAGPAGMSAAYAAKQQALKYLVLERGQIASTIENYPLGKPLFSTPNELEFEPGTLKPAGVKPTREELLDYYRRFVEREQQLQIHTNEPVAAIVPERSGLLTVETDRAHYQARAVLVAVGGMGIINRLGVPGETAERVSYLFRSAAGYRDRRVIVVGGGNSAGEATLDLCQAGAEVTLLLRRPSFARVTGGAAIKPWVQQPLEAAINAGRIAILFDTRIIEILPDRAVIETAGARNEIICDHIIALIGARPDVTLLANAGAAIGSDGRPEYNPETYETTIKNLFVVGHLTRELHMKHAVTLPPHIIEQIAAGLKNS